MQRRSIRRSDPRYQKLRRRNNESVKKSREKSRRQQDETIESIHQLEVDNQQLIENIRGLKNEYQQLYAIFKQHTGIDIDQIPKPSEDENPPAPVLSINTTETNSSSNNELDSSNLDGSIVLINGVQYKIISLT